jgi:hypothetical protein
MLRDFTLQIRTERAREHFHDARVAVHRHHALQLVDIEHHTTEDRD